MKSERTITQRNNVTLRVIDAETGRIDQEHSGHNSVTTTLLEGIAHYLQGYGLDNQGMLLKSYLPNYISLGTAGLRNYNPTTNVQLETFNSDGSYRDSGQQGVQNSQTAWLDSTALNDGLNTVYFPTDIPSHKYVPDIRAIHGSALVNGDIPELHYFNQPPGFDADIRAEVIRADLDNNRRPKSGLGVPFQRIREDYIGGLTSSSASEHLNICPICGNVICYCVCSHHGSEMEVLSPNPLECELISDEHGRSSISAKRAFYPLSRVDGMNTAESLRSVDVVYTALISLGALASFRGNRDYIFITECGLWGTRWTGERYSNTVDDASLRGKFKVPADMLAGYRIYPPGWTPQDLTDSLVDRVRDANGNPTNTTVTITPQQRFTRRMRQLQRCILRVGKGQVVQVEWKVQLLALDLSRDLFRQNYATTPDVTLGMNGNSLY